MVANFSLKQFVWDKASRQLLGDASMLGFSPGAAWPDTLNVKSHHTGTVEQFSWNHTLWSPEGECHGMVYSPANAKLGIRLTVFST